ncbi:SET domain-containing protein-lysine N-methyltransferase [uncultured Roseibium sp.]|uniref:SET domain-containing protein-lysine N-methyltransferase n=1 Tax=uncultured Roseibium sp. TaxID=1936171 RepID=UPI0026287F72|nr:SET domain-containing protein-lysine N-methyltransferase [uncultured Roseibium sp.]
MRGVVAQRPIAKGEVVFFGAQYLRVKEMTKLTTAVSRDLQKEYSLDAKAADKLVRKGFENYSWAGAKDAKGYVLRTNSWGAGNITSFINHDDKHRNMEAFDLPTLDRDGKKASSIIGYYALRDIKEGEQILVYYGAKYFDERTPDDFETIAQRIEEDVSPPPPPTREELNTSGIKEEAQLTTLSGSNRSGSDAPIPAELKKKLKAEARKISEQLRKDESDWIAKNKNDKAAIHRRSNLRSGYANVQAHLNLGLPLESAHRESRYRIYAALRGFKIPPELEKRSTGKTDDLVQEAKKISGRLRKDDRDWIAENKNDKAAIHRRSALRSSYANVQAHLNLGLPSESVDKRELSKYRIYAALRGFKIPPDLEKRSTSGKTDNLAQEAKKISEQLRKDDRDWIAENKNDKAAIHRRSALRSSYANVQAHLNLGLPLESADRRELSSYRTYAELRGFKIPPELQSKKRGDRPHKVNEHPGEASTVSKRKRSSMTPPDQTKKAKHLPSSYKSAKLNSVQQQKLPAGHRWLNVEADGNCFYHALAIALGRPNEHAELRQATAAYAATRPGHVTPEAVRAIATPGEYTGPAEIGPQLAAFAHNVRIGVVLENGDISELNYDSRNGEQPQIMMARANDHFFLAYRRT